MLHNYEMIPSVDEQELRDSEDNRAQYDCNEP